MIGSFPNLDHVNTNAVALKCNGDKRTRNRYCANPSSTALEMCAAIRYTKVL